MTIALSSHVKRRGNNVTAFGSNARIEIVV
jgi:hypothetical protein